MKQTVSISSSALPMPLGKCGGDFIGRRRKSIALPRYPLANTQSLDSQHADSKIQSATPASKEQRATKH